MIRTSDRSVGQSVFMTDVAWQRLADDLRVTTGRQLVLQLARADDSYWWDIEISLDGNDIGGIGRTFSEEPEDFLANLADALCESHLDEQIWGGWPICPDHGTHPLNAGLHETGKATWFCPHGRAIAAIGALPPPQ
jgi:hypothetical protein